MLRLLALSALLASLPLLAQQGGGTISGVVTDAQNASIPAADIRIRNTGTNSTFRTKANEQGFFTAPGLPVGDYEVITERIGFKRSVRSGITLQVNQTAQVDVRLELGQLADSIVVTGEAPAVNTSNATVGEVIENRRVRDLPLNGRNALALTLLTSGVISNAGPTNSGFGDRGIQISSISINGSPNSMNAQMLDGSNNILSYVGEVGVPPAVDAVEEFKVQSGTMSAEFGFTAGGTINLVTKSGTNKFRGSLYEFLRNDKFDARNTFSPNKLPFRYNQYGGTIGGPIRKDRTFAFFNYEDYKSRRSSPRIASVPLANWRTGDFSNLLTVAGAQIPVYDPATTRNNPNGTGQLRDQFPANQVPRSRFDSIAPKIVDLWPLPNRTPQNAFTQAQNFQDAGRSLIDWTQWNVKVDHRFTDRNSMFVRYTSAQHKTSADNFFSDPTAGSNRFDTQVNRNAVVSDTHTFSPTLINDLRVGIMRQSFLFIAANFNQNWPRKLGLPAIVPNDQMPLINFGYGEVGGGAAGTRGSLNWDIQNTLTKVFRSHTIKLGYNHRLLQGGNQQGAALSGNFAFSGLTTNPQVPAATGSGLAQFLLGEVSSASIDRILGNTWVGFSSSLFVQDDWKVNRRLTLNLGLRYDFQQKPYERNNGQINFDLNATDLVSGFRGRTVYAGLDGQPRTFLKEDYNDVSPRFGFAWDLFGTSKTVLRGGYGVFYPPVFWRNFLGNTQLFTTTSTNYAALGPGQRAFRFAQGFPSAPLESPGAKAGPGALLGQGVSLTEDDPTTPLTQQWNLSLQHELRGWLIDVTYAGNKGNHFVSSGYNINTLAPAVRQQLGRTLQDVLPNPLVGKVPGGLGAATISRERSLLPYPHYQGVSIRNPRYGNYLSHQLQINVKRRMAKGLLVHWAFTGGKKMSDGVAVPVDFGPVEQTNENGFQDSLTNRKLNKSVDPADVSQRSVTSLLYELPFGRGKMFNPSNVVINKVVSGWQVNMINVIQTGVPLTVRGANNFAADRPNSTGQSAKLDNPTRTSWFRTDVFVNPPDYELGNVGRTTPDVRHPGAINFDISLLKSTTFAERFRLEFRAEAFNIANHVNLGLADDNFVPGTDGKNRSSTFGTVNSARDARIVQLGLKLIF
ncbi:MAG: TonB-dependent receptor [Acidobacteria bacterium]|nr:TonB-dependent receptor [Acidobacteriota bacterium]